MLDRQVVTQAADWFVHADAVVAAVARAWPGAPRDQLYDAFVDALLEVCEKGSYDPERGTVVALLIAATKSRIKDRMRSETARQQREKKYEEKRVAHRGSAAREALEVLVDQEADEHIRKYAARTAEERRFLEQWEQGADDMAQLGAALGLQHLSAAEQAVEVQRTRKRITKRLERWRKGREASP